jgi:hypothetical protein
MKWNLALCIYVQLIFSIFIYNFCHYSFVLYLSTRFSFVSYISSSHCSHHDSISCSFIVHSIIYISFYVKSYRYSIKFNFTLYNSYPSWLTSYFGSVCLTNASICVFSGVPTVQAQNFQLRFVAWQPFNASRDYCIVLQRYIIEEMQGLTFFRF